MCFEWDKCAEAVFSGLLDGARSLHGRIRAEERSQRMGWLY